MATREIENITITQTATLLDTILKQNYLKSDNKYFQPKKRGCNGVTYIRINRRNNFTTL
jgi:hypothetical protein